MEETGWLSCPGGKVTEGAWSKSGLSCVVNDTSGGSNAVQVSMDPHLTRSLEHIPRH